MTETATPRPNENAIISLVVFALLGFSSGLFFFGCFKLMGFHWMPMSILLTLLLIGMPIGGLLVVRFLRADLASLSLGLALQAVAMVIALGLYPFFLDPASKLDRLLAGTLEVSPLTFLIFKFLQLGLVFIPYYVVFGMNEFLGYRIALQILGRRTELAYAIFLGGTALSYVVLEFGSPWLGVVPLMVGAAAAIAAAAAVVRWQLRLSSVAWWAVTAVLAIVAVLPGLEDRYLTRLELKSKMHLRTLREDPSNRILYRRWGRYCHFSVMAQSPTRIAGFYNGGMHWFFQKGRTLEQLRDSAIDAIPFATLPPKGKVLIIGAGGGTQVQAALLHDPAKVVAVEIIPDVLGVLGGELQDRVERIYNDPRVEPVAMDGRQYLAQTDEKFDLIYLPVVDTSITMLRSLFNSAETLYTVEAFASMRDHLTENGILLVQRPAVFDRHGVLLRQYFRGMQDVGLNPYVWLDNPLAMQGGAGPGIGDPLEGRLPVYLVFGRLGPDRGVLPEWAREHLREHGFFRADDFGEFDYLPKTDDFRLRSDQLFNIFPTNPALNRNIALLIAAIVAAIVVIVVILGRMFPHGNVKAPFTAIIALSVLIGANFLMLQQFLIFSMYRVLAIPMDAVFLGSVGFLLIAGLAGMVLTAHEGRFQWALVVASAAALLLALRWIQPETGVGVLVALLVVACTGALFPSVFRGEEKMLLVVFAGDAIGALMGGVIAFLWPIAFGFSSYGLLTLAVFLATGWSVWWARRRYGLLDVQAE